MTKPYRKYCIALITCIYALAFLPNHLAAQVVNPNREITDSPFSIGEIWHCTNYDISRAIAQQDLYFVVGKLDISNELSDRRNYQTDETIISVIVANSDPDVCRDAKFIDHIGFTESSLMKCEPELVETVSDFDDHPLSEAFASAYRRWRPDIGLQNGVIVDLSPSRFLYMLERDRCGD